jgi:hypothetical protein
MVILKRLAAIRGLKLAFFSIYPGRASIYLKEVYRNSAFKNLPPENPPPGCTETCSREKYAGSYMAKLFSN